MTSKNIILSLYPNKLTVGHVRQLLVRIDDDARQRLSDLILHRLRDRYITPLENVPIKFRSGFLTMAAACLLIETFQCFKDGKKDTKGRGNGEEAFKSFFRSHSAEFPGIEGAEFYQKIRCGILHQAQTHGSFRIVRKGPVFDGAKKTINASRFLKNLKSIVEAYVSKLRVQDMHAVSWTNALRKIGYICEAIENE